jgi:hypothetical protein
MHNHHYAHLLVFSSMLVMHELNTYQVIAQEGIS